MSKILFVFSALTFGLGLWIVWIAKSAFHEQIAAGIFVCAAVLLSAACIVRAVDRVLEFLKEQAEIQLISTIHERNPREKR